MPAQPEVSCTNWKHRGSWVKLEVHAIENYTKPNLHLKAERIQDRLLICVVPTVSPPRGQMRADGKMKETVECVCVRAAAGQDWKGNSRG